MKDLNSYSTMSYIAFLSRIRDQMAHHKMITTGSLDDMETVLTQLIQNNSRQLPEQEDTATDQPKPCYNCKTPTTNYSQLCNTCCAPTPSSPANCKQYGGTHYQSSIQVWDFILANNLGFLEGNAIKYITRHSKKNNVEDINKAIHYLEKLKEQL